MITISSTQGHKRNQKQVQIRDTEFKYQHKIFTEYQQRQIETSPNDYYFIDGNDRLKQQQEQFKKEELFLVQLSEQKKRGKEQEKKKTDTKINLDFLKCYWKKDYQQLAQTIIQNKVKQQKKELPFLVTSYSKDTSTIVMQPKNLQYFNRHNKSELTCSVEKPLQKNVSITARQDNQQFGHLKFRQSLTLKKIQKNKEKELGMFMNFQQTNTSQNLKQTKQYETSEDSPKSHLKSGHIFKGVNLKQNIKKHAYKNLDTLMEQNNIFYLKYNPFQQTNTKLNASIKDSQQALGTHNKLSKRLTPTNKFRLQANTTLHRTPGGTNSQKFFQDSLQKDEFHKAESEQEDEFLMNNIEQLSFPTQQLKNICINQRQSFLPQMILVLYVDGILGFQKNSYFGFSQDYINQSFQTEAQVQIGKLFTSLILEDSCGSNVFFVFKSLKDIIKTLTKCYQIILILEEDSTIFEAFNRYLKERKIFVDGIYTKQINQTSLLVTEYNQILHDFKIPFPKRFIIINPHEHYDTPLFSDVSQSTIKKPQSNSMGKGKTEPFAQNNNLVRTGKVQIHQYQSFQGLFPKIGKGSDLQNIRIVLLPKLTYRYITTLVKNNEHLPQLETLEQISIAVLSDSGLLHFIQKFKQNFFKLNFKDLFVQMKQDLQSKEQRDEQRQDKLNKLYSQFKQELDQEPDIYDQDYADQFLQERKRKFVMESQQKVQRAIKRSYQKGQPSEEQIDDINYRVQVLVDDLYQKNKNIFRKILKARIQIKTCIQQTQPINPKEECLDNYEIDNQLKFCELFDEQIIYNNLAQQVQNKME